MERGGHRPRGVSGKLATELHWFKPYAEVLQWREPFARWFAGGLTNVAYNCLDIHLSGPRRNKAAMIWEGEPGDTRVLTYQKLHAEVCKFANVLKRLGIGQGDVVSIYMPMIPELVVAMLACAGSGLSTRSSSAGSRPRRSPAGSRTPGEAPGHGGRRLAARQRLPLKENVDQAPAKSPTLEKCIVQPTGAECRCERAATSGGTS